MDSTLIQCQNKPSASKLPIKRKNPDPNLSPPDPSPERIDGRAPPFKFHRIWTEPDEIRFLQGLLDCSSQNLAFPRDLGIFYARFSNTMSQPYTKSQLSEKLRRLRKKFRVISTRFSKGMDRSQLSTHDRALYDFSKRLWHQDYAATSPFSGARNVGLSQNNNNNDDDNNDNNNNNNNNNNNGGASSSDGKLKTSSLVKIKVDFSPTLPVAMSSFDQGSDVVDAYLNLDSVDNENGVGDEGGVDFSDVRDESNQYDEVKLSEVKVKLEGEVAATEVRDDEENEEIGPGQNSNFGLENEIEEVTSKVVMNVFDECFKDMRTRVLADQGGESVNTESFELRWQRQRIAELDVLRSRLSLVLEHNSLKKQ